MGILSERSVFFKDMFSLPPDSEPYEGFPLVVEVHDSPDDWRPYLTAIYEWLYFRPGRNTKFEIVAVIARMEKDER
ncbi:hypothetical protein JAAARDRAFT_57309 [Jaapia argillacea MUCL 33604]|uniref:BTB domain-containing protein n=1 Tax=Jaapia argillacea MUCL 33604 TaxID=933084 RepID=A0A067PUC8_9AGAM|nr:hypothetical protein JAAARDRAFT_57309 [Jaapia argillacea MUCL 33604]